MKKVMVGLLSLVLIVAIFGCSDETDPKFRVRNELTEKANVQIQTSGGNTININEIAAGQTTQSRMVAEGNTVVTAVIQKEPVSPTVTFYAAKDFRYTIVIRKGTPPSLFVEKE